VGASCVRSQDKPSLNNLLITVVADAAVVMMSIV
jgi:hypothetical protein